MSNFMETTTKGRTLAQQNQTIIKHKRSKRNYSNCSSCKQKDKRIKELESEILKLKVTTDHEISVLQKALDVLAKDRLDFSR